jgi:hypothetical protein
MLGALSKRKQVDAVVFLRPDVQIISELPVYLVPRFGLGSQTVFVPDFHRSCDGGELNDRMAMGNLPAALAYGKRLVMLCNAFTVQCSV